MHLIFHSNIHGGRGVRATALVLALAAAAIVAGPAAAAPAPTSNYGNTVECRYRAGGPGPAYDWRIKRLVVTPPVVYAKKLHQTVGWRFVVTRSLNSGDLPWKVIYKSPIQKRTTTTTAAAAFDPLGVDVTIPKVDDVASVQYHVKLRLFWYRADGSVQSKQSYLMPWMKWILNGHYYQDYDNNCQAGFYEGP